MADTAPKVWLRDVVESDLDVFFENQLDPAANYMAAFTAKNPGDRVAFDAHWRRILADEQILIKSIIFKNQVVGSVLSYVQFGEREVSYWIGRRFWGKGIATQALALYIADCDERPLYGRAAKDNIGSIRVMEKCGFVIIGEEKGFANARGAEIEEVVLKLEG